MCKTCIKHALSSWNPCHNVRVSHHMPTLLQLGLNISNARSTDLVWLQRGQWNRNYETDLTCKFNEVLIDVTFFFFFFFFATAIQPFHKTLNCVRPVQNINKRNSPLPGNFESSLQRWVWAEAHQNTEFGYKSLSEPIPPPPPPCL